MTNSARQASRERLQLPGILGRIEHLTSTDVAVAVARQYGGLRMYVPRRLADDHPLIKLIGRPHAVTLCEHLGGTRIEVPAGRAAVRYHEARRRRRLGESCASIARALQLTHGHVRSLVADIVPEGSEGNR